MSSYTRLHVEKENKNIIIAEIMVVVLSMVVVVVRGLAVPVEHHTNVILIHLR